MRVFSSSPILAVVTLFCSFIASTADATLYPLTDPVFGAGALTRDSATQLDWLDLPLSQGRTYIDVADEFGPGGDFAGFGHATIDELTQLYTNAGIPVINEGGSPDNNVPAVVFIALVGATSEQLGNPETRGFTSSTVIGSPGTRANGDLDWVLSDPSYYNVQTSISRNEMLIFPNVGHWLVRAILPGDFDLDGNVDIDDYLAWRTNFGSTTNLASDGNYSGTVDAADYAVWRNAVGLLVGIGNSNAVPELASGCLIALGALTIGWHTLSLRRRAC